MCAHTYVCILIANTVNVNLEFNRKIWAHEVSLSLNTEHLPGEACGGSWSEDEWRLGGRRYLREGSTRVASIGCFRGETLKNDKDVAGGSTTNIARHRGQCMRCILS